MELEQRFADDEACRQYLFGLRWPQGIECSACGGRGVWKGSRNRLLCTSCRRQIYPCGHCFSGQPPPFDALVPSNVASHKPEEWDQCFGVAAGTWNRKL